MATLYSSRSHSENTEKIAAEITAVHKAQRPENWTVILVSGAWHVRFHCEPPTPYFKDAGYNYIPLPLPAAGGKTSTLEENLSAISSTIASELNKPGQQIAIILQSAAGLIGTEAINRILASQPSAAERIRIIYLAAIFEYGPIVTHLASAGHLRIDDKFESFWCDTGYEAFYGDDMTEAEAQPYVEALTFQKMIGATLNLSSEAWRACDLTSVVCLKDKVVPLEWRYKLAEEYGMRIVQMDTGHCPFVTRPREFAEMVDGVVREGMKTKTVT